MVWVIAPSGFDLQETSSFPNPSGGRSRRDARRPFFDDVIVCHLERGSGSFPNKPEAYRFGLCLLLSIDLCREACSQVISERGLPLKELMQHEFHDWREDRVTRHG